MTLVSWVTVLRRRWIVVATIIGVVALASAVLAIQAYHERQYMGTVELYVSVVPTPGSATETAAQLLASETAANYLGDDLLAVAHSNAVARSVSRDLARRHVAYLTPTAVESAVGGGRAGRTLTITASYGTSRVALAMVGSLTEALTTRRAAYVGPAVARGSYVDVLGRPAVGRVVAGRPLHDFVLRVFLGTVVAVGAAFAWDFLDDTVQNPEQVEASLSAPVLARFG